jgi:hypothetical protein
MPVGMFTLDHTMETVLYEFQRSGNHMMRIRRQIQSDEMRSQACP